MRNLNRKNYSNMSKEIEMLYLMSKRMTAQRRDKVMSRLSETNQEKMLMLLEETGYHRSDYDSEKPFNSNYNE